LEGAVEYDPVDGRSDRELEFGRFGRTDDRDVGGSRQYVCPLRFIVGPEHEARSGERGEPWSQEASDEFVVDRDLVATE